VVPAIVVIGTVTTLIAALELIFVRAVRGDMKDIQTINAEPQRSTHE
jgi:hypothetical protein